MAELVKHECYVHLEALEVQKRCVKSDQGCEIKINSTDRVIIFPP